MSILFPMGCLVLVVIILVIVIFWKLILEMALWIGLAAGCALLPACRENIFPLLEKYGESLFANPGQTIFISILAGLMLYAIASWIVNALYTRFAPRHLREQYPTWSDFKKGLRDAMRD